MDEGGYTAHSITVLAGHSRYVNLWGTCGAPVGQPRFLTFDDQATADEVSVAYRRDPLIGNNFPGTNASYIQQGKFQLRIQGVQDIAQANVANGRPNTVVGDRALRAGPILDEEN